MYMIFGAAFYALLTCIASMNIVFGDGSIGTAAGMICYAIASIIYVCIYFAGANRKVHVKEVWRHDEQSQ
jgi:hypothetical protein